MAKKKRSTSGSTVVKAEPVAPPKASIPYWAIAVPVTLMLLIGLIWTVGVFVLDADEKTPAKESAAPAVTDGPLTTGGKNPRPSGDVDKHRLKITNQATALLKQARLIGGGGDSSSLVGQIAKGDESGLPKDFVSKFRFVDKLKDEKEIRAAGLIALIQLGQVLDSNLPADHELEPLTDKAWQFTYVDMEAGHAFVPLSLYLGEESAFSFEFVWVNGEWVFSPYSLIDAISAADVAASGARDSFESGN